MLLAGPNPRPAAFFELVEKSASVAPSCQPPSHHQPTKCHRQSYAGAECALEVQCRGRWLVARTAGPRPFRSEPVIFKRHGGSHSSEGATKNAVQPPASQLQVFSRGPGSKPLGCSHVYSNVSFMPKLDCEKMLTQPRTCLRQPCDQHCLSMAL